MPPDMIKVDRALMQDCDRDGTRRAILRAVLAMCADIGITVVLEGVERREEAATLRGLGARLMQGFYFARPVF